MIQNLVLSSGGIMGFGFVGAYNYLYEKNMHLEIKNILGCSVGSLMGLVISLGYTSKEIEGITLGMDTSKMIDKDNNFLDIIDNLGYDKGDKLIRLTKILIKKKCENEDITFKEHFKLFKKKIIVVGSNIDKVQDIYFNYKTHPNMKIWEAIRISCSIPVLFTPYKYEEDLYVDGALNNPCPINYFKDQDKTLGFILEKSLENNKTTDLKSYLSNIVFYNLRINKKRKIKKKIV